MNSTSIDNIRRVAGEVGSELYNAWYRMARDSSRLLLDQAGQTATQAGGVGGFGALGSHVGEVLGESIGRGLFGTSAAAAIGAALGKGIVQFMQTQETYRMLGAKLAPQIAAGREGLRQDYHTLGVELTKEFVEIRKTTNASTQDITQYVGMLARLGKQWDSTSADGIRYLIGLDKILLLSKESTARLMESSTTKFGESNAVTNVIKDITGASEYFNSQLATTNHNIFEAYRSNEVLTRAYLDLVGSLDKTGVSIQGLTGTWLGMTNVLIEAGLRPGQINSITSAILEKMVPSGNEDFNKTLEQSWLFKQLLMGGGDLGPEMYEMLRQKTMELGLPELMASAAVPYLLAESPEMTPNFLGTVFQGIAGLEKSKKFQGMDAESARANAIIQISKFTGMTTRDALASLQISKQYEKFTKGHSAEEAFKMMSQSPDFQQATQGTSFEGRGPEEIVRQLAGVAPAQQSVQDKMLRATEQMMASLSDFSGPSFWDKFVSEGKGLYEAVASHFGVGGKDAGSFGEKLGRSNAQVRSLRRQVKALKSRVRDPGMPPVQSKSKKRNTISVGQVPMSTAGGVEVVNYETALPGQDQTGKTYTPGSTAARELFRDAARIAGVPESWASSPGLHAILRHESGGQVGRPNYTYGSRAQNPESWKGVGDELRQGTKSAKSSATGLGQLLLSNVDRYYPSGRAGIGNATEEAVGMLRYIQDRYGTPEQAWELYGKLHEGY